MDRLEQLKTKYAAVLQYISTHNVRLDNLHVENDKLFLKGAAPNEASKNDVWNAIKAVDASYGDVTAEF
ncbi:MAG: peptidoglycan-binding protein, partial [Bryobacteraceae bacterium]|nr:peptidoglycan-binding protein [Bryobacteraceae bacterium]